MKLKDKETQLVNLKKGGSKISLLKIKLLGIK